LGKGGGGGTQRGHQAEDRQRQGDDAAAVAAVRQHRQRQTQQGIDQNKRWADQEAHGAVAKMKLGADLRQEHSKDVAIQKVGGLDQEHHRHRQGRRAANAFIHFFSPDAWRSPTITLRQYRESARDFAGRMSWMQGAKYRAGPAA
jgi:hypothetical protein